LFLASTLQKFVNGGWLPISIAFALSCIMIVWQYGTKTVQKHAREQSPTDDDIASCLEQSKLTLRSPGTAIFFSDAHLSITPEFGVWKMIKNFHVLPSRTILLSIQTVRVPFVSPTTNGQTALRFKTLGNGMYNVTATFGYFQSVVDANIIARDIIAELDRLEVDFHPKLPFQEEKEAVDSTTLQEPKATDATILYLICSQQLAPAKTSTWFHRFRIALFNVLVSNTSKLEDFYNIPHEQLTEMGHTIVL